MAFEGGIVLQPFRRPSQLTQPHQHPCWAERLLEKLIPALTRAGHIDGETLLGLADDLDAEARLASVEREDELGTMAAALRLWAIEAGGQTQSEWRAERLRKQMRVIPFEASVSSTCDAEAFGVDDHAPEPGNRSAEGDSRRA